MNRFAQAFILIGMFIVAAPLRATTRSSIELPAAALSGTTFAELCAYDGGHCQRLRHENGSIRRPKRTILVVFQQIRQQVLEVAARFGVDPRTLIAVITSEHTLNVSIDDVIQDIYSRTPIGSSGRLGPLRVSYGFGQIYSDAAAAAEPIVAEIERRAPLRNDQVNTRLQTMEGALTYAAAVILDAQRQYRAAGYDVSNQPGVLATLYNIGRISLRLERTQREGRLPMVNYFGWFVEQNWTAFDEVIRNNAPTHVLNESDIEMDRVRGGRGLGDHFPVFQLAQPVPLFFRPDACRSTDTGDQIRDQYESVLNRDYQPKAERGTGRFQILQQALGCQGEVWALARFSAGTIGWLRQSDVRSQLQFRYEPRACRRKSYDACLASIREVLGSESEIIQFDELNGILSIKIKGFTDSPARDYQRFADSCYEPAVAREAPVEPGPRRFFGHQNFPVPDPVTGYIPTNPRRPNLESQIFVSDQLELNPNLYWYRGQELIELLRQTRALLARLERTLQDNWATTRRDFSLLYRLTFWIERLEDRCASAAGCVGVRPEVYQEFLSRFSPQNLQRLESLFDLLEHLKESEREWQTYSEATTLYNSSPRPAEFQPAPLVDIELARLERMNLEEQLDELESNCSSLIARSDATREALENLRTFAQENRGLPHAIDLFFGGQILLELLNGCELTQLFQDYRASDKTEPFRPRLERPCGSARCLSRIVGLDLPPETYPLFNPSQEQVAENLGKFFSSALEEMQAFVAAVPARQAQARAALVDNAPAAVRSSLGLGATSDRCLYDPAGTIARIEQLQRLECVTQVLVPREQHLVQHFSRPEGRGTMVVMGERDRFQLTLRPACFNDQGRLVSSEVY